MDEKGKVTAPRKVSARFKGQLPCSRLIESSVTVSNQLTGRPKTNSLAVTMDGKSDGWINARTDKTEKKKKMKKERGVEDQEKIKVNR